MGFSLSGSPKSCLFFLSVGQLIGNSDVNRRLPESVGKKLFRVLRASVVYLFLKQISTRRHGGHGVYTERFDLPTDVLPPGGSDLCERNLIEATNDLVAVRQWLRLIVGSNTQNCQQASYSGRIQFRNYI